MFRYIYIFEANKYLHTYIPTYILTYLLLGLARYNMIALVNKQEL